MLCTIAQNFNVSALSKALNTMKERAHIEDLFWCQLPSLSGRETLAVYTLKLESILQELAQTDFPDKIIRETTKLNIESGIDEPETLQSILEQSLEGGQVRILNLE